MNADPTGLSNRAFAALDGCTEKRVRTGRVRGELPTFPDGTLDPALAGTGWRARNRRGADAMRQSASASGEPNDSSLAEAQRAREVAIARLRQHQVAERRASVLSAADVDTLWRVLRGMALCELDELVLTLIGRVAACSDLIALRDTVQGCVYASLNRIAAKGELRREKSASSSESMIPPSASRIAAETAKTFALAELRQIDLAVAKQEMMPMDAVENAIGLRIDVARQRFLALESILPPRLIGTGGEKQAAVIRAAAADIARLLPEATPAIHAEQPTHGDEDDPEKARGRASSPGGASRGRKARPPGRAVPREAVKA